MKKTFIATAILFSSASSWALDVCGAITSDTVWTEAQSPINITCNSVLLTGKKLTIEPGVSVFASAGSSLAIRGTLTAIGTAKKKISFSSSSTDQNWQGIALATSLGASGIFDYVSISNANSGVSVECCWGNPTPATISNSRFYRNRNAVAGYSGYKIIIRKTDFIENGTALDSADKDVFDSFFQGNSYALGSTERINVYRSRFFQNDVALYGGRGVLQGSLVHGNRIGVEAFFEGFSMSDNSIYDNAVGAKLAAYDSSTRPVNRNNIYNNTEYNVVNATVRDQDATDTWWGTSDGATISKLIYDVNDDVNLGFVYTDPIAAQRHLPQAQISTDKKARIEGGKFNITVELRAMSAIQSKVGVIVSGSAVAGVDFDPASIPSTLTFKPGEYSKKFTVVTLDNSVKQPNRKLILTLGNYLNAQPSDANQVSLTIQEND